MYSVVFLGTHPKLGLHNPYTIHFDDRSFEIKATTLIAKFPADSILGIEFGERKYRSGGRAAVGAIIGGVLTGGIGLLAGAAIGGRRRSEENVTIEIAEFGRSFTLNFICKGNATELYNAFMNLLQLNTPELDLPSGMTVSLCDEIRLQLSKFHTNSNKYNYLVDLKNDGKINEDAFKELRLRNKL